MCTPHGSEGENSFQNSLFITLTNLVKLQQLHSMYCMHYLIYSNNMVRNCTQANFLGKMVRHCQDAIGKKFSTLLWQWNDFTEISVCLLFESYFLYQFYKQTLYKKCLASKIKSSANFSIYGFQPKQNITKSQTYIMKSNGIVVYIVLVLRKGKSMESWWCVWLFVKCKSVNNSFIKPKIVESCACQKTLQCFIIQYSTSQEIYSHYRTIQCCFSILWSGPGLLRFSLSVESFVFCEKTLYNKCMVCWTLCILCTYWDENEIYSSSTACMVIRYLC